MLVKYDLDARHVGAPRLRTGTRSRASSCSREATDASGEDEGYAIGFVYDEARDASDLVILDASDMAKAPLAAIHMPRRVPHGFHGSWIRG